jgi:hypothetical protein
LSLVARKLKHFHSFDIRVIVFELSRFLRICTLCSRNPSAVYALWNVFINYILKLIIECLYYAYFSVVIVLKHKCFQYNKCISLIFLQYYLHKQNRYRDFVVSFTNIWCNSFYFKFIKCQKVLGVGSLRHAWWFNLKYKYYVHCTLTCHLEYLGFSLVLTFFKFVLSQYIYVYYAYHFVGNVILFHILRLYYQLVTFILKNFIKFCTDIISAIILFSLSFLSHNFTEKKNVWYFV